MIRHRLLSQEDSQNMAELEKYINEYGRDIYSYCIYITGDKYSADDLYQQTFLTAFEKDTIDPDRNPKSYLITIATNLWNNQRRKYLWRRRKADTVCFQDISEMELPDTLSSVEDEALHKEYLQQLRLEVQGLPDKFRVVILMFYMEELSMEDISTALNIPVGTVKSRLHNAKIRLKERLTRYE